MNNEAKTAVWDLYVRFYAQLHLNTTLTLHFMLNNTSFSILTNVLHINIFCKMNNILCWYGHRPQLDTPHAHTHNTSSHPSSTPFSNISFQYSIQNQPNRKSRVALKLRKNKIEKYNFLFRRVLYLHTPSLLQGAEIK